MTLHDLLVDVEREPCIRVPELAHDPARATGGSYSSPVSVHADDPWPEEALTTEGDRRWSVRLSAESV